MVPTLNTRSTFVQHLMTTPLGHIAPYPISDIFGTGYFQFNSPFGIAGLAKESPRGLEILALVSSLPRTGQFRDFMSACKGSYARIAVWEVWNPELARLLRSYGFTETKEVQCGDLVHGWVWSRNENWSSDPARPAGYFKGGKDGEV